MQSVYSFLGSPLHLILEDDVADGYNEIATALAGRDLKTYIIRDGDVRHSLMYASPGATASYNAIADLINKLCEINGGSLDIDPDEMPHIHLVKV